MNICWLTVLLCACAAALAAFSGLAAAKGAPQEAAVAGIALCIVVIPYIFTRSLEGMAQTTWRKTMLKAAEEAAKSRSTTA